MGKADLHIHTTYSPDGSSTVQAVLEQAARRIRLDVIAITDHDEIQGALLAQKLAPSYGIEVIPGEEIATREGHLLAYFIHERVPPKLSLVETIRRVGQLGGICVAAHPMAIGVHSLSARSIQNALLVPGIRDVLIGIETINAGLVLPHSNTYAQALCAKLGLSRTGSSNSHVRNTVGDGVTEFNGSSAQDLHRALLEHSTNGVYRQRHTRSNLVLGFILRRTLRQLGWVTWNPEPNAEFVVRRLAKVQVRIDR